MFRSRISRLWGHAVIFTWSDLILDRSRRLAVLLVHLHCPAVIGLELSLFGAERNVVG